MESRKKTETILVTGITGFVGSHVLASLLVNGYNVKGTVRNLGNQEKYKFLEDFYEMNPSIKDRVELVEADLYNEASMRAAVKGVDAVIHVATPVLTSGVKDENEIIEPAVQGTLSVLRGAVEHNVVRIVVTSSTETINGSAVVNKTYTEDDHIDITNPNCIPYEKAKILAEEAAWKFVKENKTEDGRDILLTSIHPGLILGPSLTIGGSIGRDLISKIITGRYPGMPKIMLPLCDVRDVALAHVTALEGKEETFGRRYICISEDLWGTDTAARLRKEFGPYGYSVTRWKVNYCLVKLASYFNPETRAGLHRIGISRPLDNSRLRDTFDFQFRDVNEILSDAGYSVIYQGHIPDKTKGSCPNWSNQTIIRSLQMTKRNDRPEWLEESSTVKESEQIRDLSRYEGKVVTASSFLSYHVCLRVNRQILRGDLVIDFVHALVSSSHCFMRDHTWREGNKMKQQRKTQPTMLLVSTFVHVAILLPILNVSGQEKKVLGVTRVIQGNGQPEGDGATVVRLIGTRELPRLDPFLMLDHFTVKLPAGFPDHPHRGFETVTYQLKGETLHEDFLGNRGRIGPGDAQWMTAGRGIVHAEMPGSWTEESVGLQLWINLPKEYKMMEPRYQEMSAAEIPVSNADGVTVKILAGNSLGVSSSTSTLTPTLYLDVRMEPQTEFQQEIPTDWNTAVYTISGEATIGDTPERKVTPLNFALLEQAKIEGGVLAIKTGDKGARLIILSGKPLNEPVFNRGPFVLSSQEELSNSFQDYRSARNGFENARSWNSKIKNMVNEEDLQGI